MPRRTTFLAVVATLGALALAPAAAQAASGPEAVAAKSCSLAGKTRSLGPTYTTALSVRRVSCSKGQSLVRAYYDCRLDNGGRKARCGRVSGYRCGERRSNVIRTQFDARVTCKKGRRVVKHRYTQFT